MKVLQKILSWIAPVIIFGAAWVGFLWMGSQPPPVRKVVVAPDAVPVRTASVKPQQGGVDIEADGIVVPLREVTLAAEVAGRVLEKSPSCKAGQFVSKGAVLFRIDPRDYQLEVERLQRELNQAGLLIEEIDEELDQNTGTIDLARRQVAISQREVTRLDGLKANRVITEAEHDRALRDELTANNTLTTISGQNRVLAKRRNRMLEAQSLAGTMLQRAQLDLSRTTVVAPVDGMVVEERAEQESFVSKGETLVVLEDISAAEVRTSLRMDEVARVWGGQPNTALPDGKSTHDLPDTPASVVFSLGDRSFQWSGTLSRQEGKGLDAKTRTLPCRVLVSNPTAVQAIDVYGAPMSQLPPEAPRTLMRGMFVQVRVHIDSTETLVSIPEEAQRPTGEVWVVRDGTLVVLRMLPLQGAGGRVFFAANPHGLQPGDRVVTSQLANPREGMRVSETPESPAQSVPLRLTDQPATDLP